MAGTPWLIDTNLLIRWVQPADPGFHLVRTSTNRLKTLGGVCCYTSQNLGEFWNTLTRPADRNGYGLTSQEADRHAKAIEKQFDLLLDDPAVHLIWRRLLVDHQVSGVQVHDARLVASMLVHGVQRILTFNTRDFVRYPGIEAVHPKDLS
jgi:predicted nucleic acid-binding protein